MKRTIAATISLALLASASAWAQKGGGGVGGGVGGGGIKGGSGTPNTGGTPGGNLPGGVPGLPNDKNYSKEGCAWVEPYASAESAAKSDDKFFLVYVYEEKSNGNSLASDFYLLDVIQLSKTTWVFTKMVYSKDNVDLRKLAVRKPGTVLGLDKFGNEWKRLESVSTIELKGLLSSVPDQVKKFTDKLQSDFARAEGLSKSDADKTGKMFADIARLPRRGYKEIEDAAAKAREIADRQLKAAEVALSVDEKQGVAILRQMVTDYKDLPPGVEAEVRLAEIEFAKGNVPESVRRVKAALRWDGAEAFAAGLAQAKALLAKIVAAGEEKIEAAKRTGSTERAKGAAALQQIAAEFAGTEAGKKAADAAKLFQ